MGWASGTTEAQDRYITLWNAREAARGTSKERAAQAKCDAFMEGRCGSCIAKLNSAGFCSPCDESRNGYDGYVEGYDDAGPFDADGGL